MSTKISTSVNIAGVELKNPVMTASGTFGSGAEYSEFVDLSKLGAVVTKGVANVPWPGNPTPRVAEVYGGTQRFPQNGRKPFEECKGRRELDCDTDGWSRYESRA